MLVQGMPPTAQDRPWAVIITRAAFDVYAGRLHAAELEGPPSDTAVACQEELAGVLLHAAASNPGDDMVCPQVCVRQRLTCQ